MSRVNNNHTTTATKTKKKTSSTDNITIKTLGKEHMQAAADLFIKTFCDYEPITRHLGISYEEYEPFAMAVIQKAVKDGLSIVALDDQDRVIACIISEDITDLFQPNLALYPKMEPIFALIDKLSIPFLQGKKIKKGTIAHSWLSMIDQDYMGQGFSTDIVLAGTTGQCGKKGFIFSYAEFTNPISEKVAYHHPLAEKISEISYDDFSYQGQKPFRGVKGGAASYVLGLKKGVTIDQLDECFTKG